MKKLFFLLLCGCTTAGALAQTPGSYSVTPGSLHTISDITKITHLTLTGAIDARDARFMRDSMPYLTALDLSDADVAAYEGKEGTASSTYSIVYPANEMPQCSFYKGSGSGSNITLLSVVLPKSLAAIGSFAFWSCSALASAPLPAGLITIGSNAFYKCGKLTGITFPAGLTSIGNEAFYGCSSLTGNLTFPAGLTSIGEKAFCECSKLTGITLPEGLTSIGNYAFQYCDQLTGNLTLPATLTSIEYGIFYGCNFTSVTNHSLTPQGINANVFTNTGQIKTMRLTVPASALEKYKNAGVWKDFNGGAIAGGGKLLSVRVINGALGVVSGTASGLYASDTTVRLTAAPAGGYSFIKWENGGTNLGAATLLEFSLTQDTVIIAYFGRVGKFGVTPGSLNTIPDITKFTHLTLAGAIDARDAKFLRDYMPCLTELDLSDADVAAYTGTEGTYPSAYSIVYPANEMPQRSFYKSSGSGSNITLLSVVLPKSLAAIGAMAFQNCSALASAPLPAGLITIGSNAFYKCGKLTGNLTLPAGLMSIGDNAFSYCSGMTGNLTLPAGLMSIGSNAFYKCGKLTGNLTLPAGLMSIGSNAFYDCSGMTGNLTLPATLTSIGDNAFRGCSGMTGNLTLPAMLTSIGSSAFAYCNFTSVTNHSLTPRSINANVFTNTDKIKTMSLTVPASALERYAKADVWKDFNRDDIANSGRLLSVRANNGALGVVSGTASGLYPSSTPVSLTAAPAGGYSFIKWTSGGTNLSAATLLEFSLTQDTIIIAHFSRVGKFSVTPGSLNTIPDVTKITHLTLTGAIDARDVKFMRDYMLCLTELDLSGVDVAAYEGMEGTSPLTDLTTVYPANEMPPYSFYRASLVSIVLPQSLAAIGANAFRDCSALASVTFPAGLMSISSSAFYSCSGLTGITLPEGLTNIGTYAFYSCSGMTGIAFPAGLASIGSYAFSSCSGLTGNLSLPAGLTSIGDYAFYSCSGLTGNLTLPSGLTSIGSYAFYSCSGLTGNLTLPERLTSIGSNAFYYCSGMTGNLTLPAGLTSIGSSVFAYCNFTSVTTHSLTPQSIDEEVFTNTDKIKTMSLTVPASAFERYANADVWKDFNRDAGAIRGTLLSVRTNNGALGAVSGSASGLYPSGATVSLTAAPAGGYSLIKWVSGGTNLGAATLLEFSLAQDTIITAHFGRVGKFDVTPGSLNTIPDITKFTHLTLTGAIDARDVKFMRNCMLYLTELDLSGADVAAYEGLEGTSPSTSSIVYPANEMPQYSFYYNNRSNGTLLSVVLPQSLATIGAYAFRGCSALESVTFPAGLRSIGRSAFYSCIGMTGNLTLPAGLTSIDLYAFTYCNFTSVTNHSLMPQSIEENVFTSTNTVKTMSLTVPASAHWRYQNAVVWKNFNGGDITSGGMLLSVRANNAARGAVSGTASGLYPSGTSVSLKATPTGDYSFVKWVSGGTNLGAADTLRITLTQDTLIIACFDRVGKFDVTPGSLGAIPGVTKIVYLTLTGAIDARDVRFMRDSMPYLTELDLSGVAVAAYTGTEGTSSSGGSTAYPANEMPQYSFYKGSGPNNSALLSVVLPQSVATIGDNAFSFCKALAFVTLPEGLTSIGSSAFQSCSGLSGNLTLPAMLTSIGESAFYKHSFTSVANHSLAPQSIDESVFTNTEKIKTMSLIVPTSAHKKYQNAITWKDFNSGDIADGGMLLSVRANNAARGAVSGTASGFYPPSEQVSLTATPIGDYSFIKWVSSGTYLGAADTLRLTLTQDTIIIAHFSKVYTVTFNTNGGVGGNFSSQTVHGDRAIEPAPAPVKEGFHLKGWYSSATGADTAWWSFGLSTVTRDTTLYASWEINRYTVSFETNGGSSISPQAVAHGGTATTPAAAPTKSGYTFGGWYANAGFTALWNFPTDTLTEDTTLYARWIDGAAAAYTVAFDSDGGSRVDAQAVAAGDTVARPANPTLANKKFAGWSGDAERSALWNFPTDTPTGNMTLYAKWIDAKTTTYTVTFSSNGGSRVDAQTVAAGDTVVRPADPTNEGYKFVGWHANMELTRIWNFPTDTLTGNTTIYAKWMSKPLTLDSIKINGESQTVADTMYYTIPCGGDRNAIEVVYTVAANTDTLHIDASRPFRRDTVIALNSGKQYVLKLDRRFEIDSIIHVQLGGKLLMVIKNPKNNGGFNFQEASWWRKDKGIWKKAGSNFYYVSPDGEVIADTLSLRLLDSSGMQLESCPYYLPAAASAPDKLRMAVYPNPVAAGAPVHLKEELIIGLNADLEDRYATLYLLDVQGNVLYTGKSSELRQGMTMPSTPGVYFLILEGKAGRKLLKVTVLQRVVK
jgi:uncharacterized repeat protein (TIGR02543 family)